MYIDKHNRRSHINTTFSENIYFMILQPINCIKSWILNSNNNLSNQLKLSYSTVPMTCVWALTRINSTLKEDYQRDNTTSSLQGFHSILMCNIHSWYTIHSHNAVSNTDDKKNLQ